MTFNSTLQISSGYEGLFFKQTVRLPQQSNSTIYGLVYCPYTRKSGDARQVAFSLSLESYTLEQKVILDSELGIESDGKFDFAENYNLEGGSELSIVGYKFLETTAITFKSASFSTLAIKLSYSDTSNSNGYLGGLIRLPQRRL